MKREASPLVNATETALEALYVVGDHLDLGERVVTKREVEGLKRLERRLDATQRTIVLELKRAGVTS